MIVAGIVAHNEGDLIAESVRSVLAYVDRVAVLGDAKRWEYSTVIPRDRLTYVHEEESLTEVDARNALIGFCAAKDWMLAIDANEVLVGAHDSLSELRAWVLSGRWTTDALGLAVYRRNPLGEGPATVSSLDIEPRLFPVRDHQYREGEGLCFRGRSVGTGTMVSEGFLIRG